MAVRMFAAIEIGSFALELGIYEISEKTGIRCVDHIRHVIALGSDTFSEGKISYGLADEMCSVLEDFPVPASPNKSTLLASFPFTKASVFSISLCF